MNYQLKPKKEYKQGKGRRRLLCEVLECKNQSQVKGRCIKHGAITKRCSVPTCINNSITNGLCLKHGAVMPKCKVQNCSNRVVQGGKCKKHGAVVKKCKIDKCNSYRVSNGLCIRHGAKVKICKMIKCKSMVQKAGYCRIHHPEYVPLTKLSRGAQCILDYLLNMEITHETEKRFKDCRNKLPLPFDFFIPSYNLIIEYDGAQHTKVIPYWGGQLGFEMIQKHDKIKNKYCKDKKINLLRIPHTTKLKDIPQMINMAMIGSSGSNIYYKIK